MTGPSSPHGGGWLTPRRPGGDDGWGPSTAVRGGSGRGSGGGFGDSASVPPQRKEQQRKSAPVDPNAAAGRRIRPPVVDDAWSPAGPAPRGQQRANRLAERRDERSIREQENRRGYLERAPERGVPWWLGLLVLVVIAAAGGVIDTIGSLNARGGFNIGIVTASILAILAVKRSHMFPIVIAPPIVYSLGAAFQLYLRSNGLNDRRAVFDAAANYLVYGFPAIAAATAAVLIIAGIRLIIRK